MKKIIRKILKEDRRQMFLDNIVKYMKNDFPLFKNMKSYGFTEQLTYDELNYVLSGIFGEPVVRDGYYVTSNSTHNDFYYENSHGHWKKWEYDDNDNQIYEGTYDGYWEKREFDKNGNEIYISDSNGGWFKREYDENGRVIYNEDSDGIWVKREYDENGRKIYEESDNGYWWKREYDENGKILYYENSRGVIRDNR